MIYTIEGQAFSQLAPSPVSKLDPRQTRRLTKKNNLLTGEKSILGEGGAKSYDSEKGWSSINLTLINTLWSDPSCVRQTRQQLSYTTPNVVSFSNLYFFIEHSLLIDVLFNWTHCLLYSMRIATRNMRSSATLLKEKQRRLTMVTSVHLQYKVYVII